MHLMRWGSRRGTFVPLLATAAAQAAVMELKPGEVSDESVANEHPKSEQWVLILAGQGRAVVVPRGGSRRTVRLGPGALLVIERGEPHQIVNTGRKTLRTINFYVPPAYASDGSVRRRAKRRPAKSG